MKAHAKTRPSASLDSCACMLKEWLYTYSKTCGKRPLSKRPKNGFQDQLSLNAGKKYCRMLQGEHSAILLTFIKLPFVIKIFVLSVFEWPFYTGFTVCHKYHDLMNLLIVCLRNKYRRSLDTFPQIF